MKLDLAAMRGVQRPSYTLRRERLMSTAPAQAFEWYDYAIPTYAQQYDSCVGHATANWIELMVRRFVGRDAIPDGMQLDGDAIWKRGRQLFYDGSLNDGLLMPHGFGAAIEMGVLPEKSKVVTLRADLNAVAAALLDTPVLQGTSVHAGWETPSRENGSIPILLNDPTAGHATCIIAQAAQDAARGLVFQNSWGDWGRHGYGLLREDQWEDALLDYPVTCALPEGWTDFDGWKQLLIATPTIDAAPAAPRARKGRRPTETTET